MKIYEVKHTRLHLNLSLTNSWIPKVSPKSRNKKITNLSNHVGQKKIPNDFQTTLSEGSGTKTMIPQALVQEDIHTILPSSEYSPGSSGENIKSLRSKTENHFQPNAHLQHKNYFKKGFQEPETSQ